MKIVVKSTTEGTEHHVTLDNGEPLEGVAKIDVFITPGDVPRLVVEFIDFDFQVVRRQLKPVFMDQAIN